MHTSADLAAPASVKPVCSLPGQELGQRSQGGAEKLKQLLLRQERKLGRVGQETLG
jgi:hypothetical protein